MLFVCSDSWLFLLGCQYQCKWLIGKTRLWNDHWSVDGDIKPYSFTHSWTHRAALLSVSLAISRYTSQSCKATVHRVVCLFTPQLLLVLINRPRRDGMLSWRWCTVAAGEIRTRDLAIASPALYHTVTSAPQPHTIAIHKLNCVVQSPRGMYSLSCAR